jgi:hypothetical protein
MRSDRSVASGQQLSRRQGCSLQVTPLLLQGGPGKSRLCGKMGTQRTGRSEVPSASEPRGHVTSVGQGCGCLSLWELFLPRTITFVYSLYSWGVNSRPHACSTTQATPSPCTITLQVLEEFRALRNFWKLGAGGPYL